jgi:hypothetical protein
MSPIPIPDACSLERPDFDERIDWIRLNVPVPRRVLATPDGTVWEFESTHELRQTLERLVELERACCDPARIRFELHEDAPHSTLRLEIHGLSVEHPLAQAAPSGPTRNGWRRLFQAGGIGAAGTFALLCGLPPLVALVAGASLAAPLSKLESPWLLAAGTLGLGALAWGWLRRARLR